MATTKIQSTHQERIAFVYVRQSTPVQVIENRESTERQYRLRDRAIELGWPPSQVEVIDEDPLGECYRNSLPGPWVSPTVEQVHVVPNEFTTTAGEYPAVR